MDIIGQLGIGSTVEIALGAAICYGFSYLIKQTHFKNIFLPWVSVLAGIVSGLIAAYFYHDSLATGAILGLLLGFATSGAYDGVKAFTSTSAPNNSKVKSSDTDDGDIHEL